MGRLTHTISHVSPSLLMRLCDKSLPKRVSVAGTQEHKLISKSHVSCPFLPMLHIALISPEAACMLKYTLGFSHWAMLQQILGSLFCTATTTACRCAMPEGLQRCCRVFWRWRSGPRGMAPHLVLQTPGMPSPYMQVQPHCPQASTAGSCFARPVCSRYLLDGLIPVTSACIASLSGH